MADCDDPTPFGGERSIVGLGTRGYSTELTCDASPSNARQYFAKLLDRPDGSIASRVLQSTISLFILASTFLTIVETLPEVRKYRSFFVGCDHCVTAVFTVELALRIFAADSCALFCSSAYNVIDILALCPGYVELWLQLRASEVGGHLHKTAVSMRTLRTIRVLRLMRVGRVFGDWGCAKRMMLFFRVTWNIAHEGLWLIVSLLGIFVVLGASLIYLFEAPQCIDARGSLIPMCSTNSEFVSIPASAWWVIATLSTVGYGDIVPATPMGRFVGGLMCLGGVMNLAITAAQFAFTFRQQWRQERAKSDFKDRVMHDPAMLCKREDIEDLLESLTLITKHLVDEVSDLSAEVDASASIGLRPLAMSIKEQAAGLNRGLCSFVYEALAESIYRAPGDKSPVRERSRMSGFGDDAIGRDNSDMIRA